MWSSGSLTRMEIQRCQVQPMLADTLLILFCYTAKIPFVWSRTSTWTGQGRGRTVSPAFCFCLCFVPLLAHSHTKSIKASKWRISWRSPISILTKHPRRRNIRHALYCTLLLDMGARGYVFTKISNPGIYLVSSVQLLIVPSLKLNRTLPIISINSGLLEFLWLKWATYSQPSQHLSPVSPSVSAVNHLRQCGLILQVLFRFFYLVFLTSLLILSLLKF